MIQPNAITAGDSTPSEICIIYLSLKISKRDVSPFYLQIYFLLKRQIAPRIPAIAIGNPFGLDKTFTVGVISATGRKDVDFMGGSQSHIQTDASINPGNSGGPLINVRGEVIGINRMIYTRSGGYMGIGFAIPINMAKALLPQLKEKGKVTRGWLGVVMQPWEPGMAEKFGLDEETGALIGDVRQGDPADRAGIRRRGLRR